jgi:hypothetical protein
MRSQSNVCLKLQPIQCLQFHNHQCTELSDHHQLNQLLKLLPLNHKLLFRDQPIAQSEFQCKLSLNQFHLMFHNFKSKLNAGVNS